MNNYIMNPAKPNYYGSHKASTALSQQFNTISAAPETEQTTKNRLLAENEDSLTKSASRDRRAAG